MDDSEEPPYVTGIDIPLIRQPPMPMPGLRGDILFDIWYRGFQTYAMLHAVNGKICAEWHAHCILRSGRSIYLDNYFYTQREIGNTPDFLQDLGACIKSVVDQHWEQDNNDADSQEHFAWEREARQRAVDALHNPPDLGSPDRPATESPSQPQ